MKFIWRTFLKGLVAMIPLVVTIWLLAWIAGIAESVLGGPISLLMPHDRYIPGMGVAVGLIAIFFIGLFLNMVIARVLFLRFEALLGRLPLVKSLYGAVKDLIGFFMDTKTKGQQAVMVTLWQPSVSATSQTTPTIDPLSPNPAYQPIRLLGLVTREDFTTLPEGMGDDQSVAVYIPMSYQLGGFTMIVRKSQIQPIAMSTEETLRFVITAGMTSNNGSSHG